MEDFSIEITLDSNGVRGVRVYGTDWERGAAAYALLKRVGPLIQQLDELARIGNRNDQSVHSDPGAVQ